MAFTASVSPAALLDLPIPPQEVLANYWPLFLISLVTGLVMTPIARSIALASGIMDMPDDSVKTHKQAIPYLGGLGIYVAWLAGMVVALHAMWDMPTRRMWVIGILIGSTIAFLTGVIDDIKDIKPSHKLIGQTLAAVALIAFGIGTDIAGVILHHMGIHIPYWLSVLLSIPITLFIVLGACNATNLIDGLDGLCGGVAGVVSLGMLGIAVFLAGHGNELIGDPVRVVVCLVLLGAVLGFLPYNFNPARIFMGDAGSLVIGFVIASAILMFIEKSIIRWFIGALMVFGLPIFDTALAMLRRLVNGKPLFAPDRGHFYDQLIDRGWSVRKTVITSYILAGGFALLGLIVTFIRTRYTIMIYLAVVLALLLIVWKTGMLQWDTRNASDSAASDDA